MAWTVVTLNAAVDEEIDALPADMRAKLTRLSQLIELHGPHALPRESFDHLEDKLWELRIRGRAGIARHLRDGNRATRGDREGLYQEDAKDAALRT
jgi:hypothetical protein